MSAKLLKVFLSSGVIKSISILVGLVNVSILTNVLGSKIYGLYMFSLSTIMIFTLILTSGAPQALTKYVALYRIRRKTRCTNHITTFVYQKLFFLSILYAALIVLVIISPWQIFKIEMVWIAFLLPPLVAFCNISNGYLKGLGRPHAAAFPLLVAQPAVIALCVLLSRKELVHDLSTILKIHTGTSLLMATTYYFLVRPKFAIHSWSKIYSLNSYVNKKISNFTKQQILSTLSLHFPTLVIGYFLGASDITFFRVAEKIVLIVNVPLIILNMMIGPYLTNAIEQNLIHKFYKKVQIFVVALSIFMMVMMFVLINTVFPIIFQADILLPAKNLAYILCLAPLINNFFGPIGHILNYLGEEAAVARYTMITMGLQIFLLMVLTPMFQLGGVIITIIFTTLFLNVACYRKYISKEF